MIHSTRLSLALLASVACAGFAAADGPRLTLNKGDHIAIIGNTLAERMQHYGWLETLLHSRFPKHELVVRNLGFSSDELTVRLRCDGFGSQDFWLTKTQADVIFAFFGFNESFAGKDGLDKFKQDLDQFIKHTLSQKYNGKSAPRLVLFSPIANENLHDRNLPNGEKNNERLELYRAAMAEACRTNHIVFVDLFTPTLDKFPLHWLLRSKEQSFYRGLTTNGIHLNEAGDKFIASEIDMLLFGEPLKIEAAQVTRLRGAVNDKNFYWFHRYRTTDGYSTYGGRADLKFVDNQTNREVLQRELEILELMTANRDKRVWALAQGKDLAVDDSNLPPFIPVKTNKPGNGPNGTHLFLGGEEAIGKMTVHKGMKVNLFASEEMFPEVVNPVQMAFDTRGRLWVAVWPSYPHWKPREEMNDKLLILEDTDGDGKADKCTVFADKLHNPTGFEFWNGGVLVAMAPDLFFLKDTDGDGKADVRERVLHGLDSGDTHHTANSFILDPGGALYFQEGIFHRTQIETPYGPVRNIDACVWRFEPRTLRVERYIPYNFANPHGHIFDRWGQDFVYDGTTSESWHGALFSGHLDFPKKHPRPPTLYEKRTRPCPGVEILSSRHFPEEFQGNLLVGNVIGFQGILQYKVADKSSSFAGTEVEPIVFSSDPNFRPADIEMGPDGAIYFTDWQNPIIGHMQHNLRDPSRDRTHGRVYRVTYQGRDLLKPAPIGGEPIEKLLDHLKEPEDRVRYRARIELSGRKTDEVVAAAKKWAAALDKTDPEYAHHLLEALWVHQHHNVVNEELLATLLQSPDYRARAAAVRVLVVWRERVANPLGLLQKLVDDVHPRVRLEAVRACSFFRDARAAEIALLILKQPMDEHLRYTLNETMTQLEPFWRKAVADGLAFAADNPAGANYLLGKVTNAELVKMPRTPLVYAALLSRDGILPEYREEAVNGLAKANKTDAVSELFAAIDRLDKADHHDGGHVLHDLAALLAKRQAAELAGVRERLEELATQARQPVTREVAYVTMITADGSLDRVWDRAAHSLHSLHDVVDAIPLIPDAKLRAKAYPKVEPLLRQLPEPLASEARAAKGLRGRFVRIDLPGDRRTLTLAEVQVFSKGQNIALRGQARQSSTGYGGDASRAIDGNTSGAYGNAGQTHTAENQKDPWWELDLLVERPIDAIVVWNRSEQNGQFASRLDGFKLTVRDGHGHVTFEKAGNQAPAEKVRFNLVGDPGGDLRRAAINAVVSLGSHETEIFSVLAGFIRDGVERETAVAAIGRIAKTQWPSDQVRPLIEGILNYVSKLSSSERTDPAVLDVLQLGSDLASVLPLKEAKQLRTRLGELGVQVIRIRTVPHKGVYDRPTIYVEAGKPVVLILENLDLMPHNLVVGAPGALAEIGIAAEKMAAEPDAFARNFIPRNSRVLHAIRMLQPRETQRLAFTAPTALGEYPYVCTFPGHWRVMYGMMHVVPKLADVPLEDLQPPADLVTQSRPFVRKWTFDELAPELARLDNGRSFERGKSLFTAASCVQCHKMQGQGGIVAPDLAELPQKLNEKKFTRPDILREILEPSKVINEKYRTYLIETSKGDLVTGVVVEQNDKTIQVVTNPNVKPREIVLKDIVDKTEAKVSMMPEGLLVTLDKDEILDLLAYIMSGGDGKHAFFKAARAK